MDTRDAVELIRGAIPRRPGTWADVGAGEGTFTRALVELLGPEARVYALDRDPRAIEALERWAKVEAANVIPLVADFTAPFELPGLGDAALDGMLLANALHYTSEAARVLGRLSARLRPGGRFVLVEYDRSKGNPWVPYPIPISQLPELFESAGFSTPVVTASRLSAFGGKLYVAAAERPVPTAAS